MIEKISLVNSITQDKTKTNSTNPIVANQEIFSQKEIEKSEDIYRDLGVEISEPDEPDIPPAKDPNPPKDIKSKVEKPKALIAKSLKDEFKIQDISKANTTVVDENSGYVVTYDENGKISEIKSPDGKFIRHIEETTFTDTKINEEENYFEETTYNKQRKSFVSKQRYYTDNENKILERIDFFKDGTPFEFNRFIYDENGIIIKKECHDVISNKKSYSELEHYSNKNYFTIYTPIDIDCNNYVTGETKYTADGCNIIEENNYEGMNLTDQDYCKLRAKEKMLSKTFRKIIHIIN